MNQGNVSLRYVYGDDGDLVHAIFENYDRLDKDLQAELPLKRIWALVMEE
jgi:predicted Mrr-cat superfamily restriction endonuclease